MGLLGVKEGVDRLVLTDELLDLLVGHGGKGLDGVGDDEPIQAVHDRKADVHVLSDPEGHDGVVVGLLDVLGEKLYPAAVPRAHGVGVIAMDVDGSGQGPVGHGHDHRKAHGSSDVKHLPHECQAGRCGGGHCSRARGAGADADAHGAVLRFRAHVLGIDLSVGDIVGERLNDDGLWSYRVRCADIRVDLFPRKGDRLVSVHR